MYEVMDIPQLRMDVFSLCSWSWVPAISNSACAALMTHSSSYTFITTAGTTACGYRFTHVSPPQSLIHNHVCNDEKRAMRWLILPHIVFIHLC